MSASTAIGQVSAALRELLLGEMQPQVTVTILAPDEPGGDTLRVNLFLYKVQENPFFQNQNWQVSPTDSSKLIPPPLSLNLYYLVTPYAPNDAELGNAPAHEILGDAMRVFYEYPVVPDAYLDLVDDLGTALEEIRIMQNGLNLEELSHVWSTFSEPLRLSVLYEISVVQLDQSEAKERDVPERVRQIGVPEVQAPYRPPVVERIEPISGPVTTDITLHGQNLEGWRVYVTVLNQVIVDGVELTGDPFEFPFQGQNAPGFNELQGTLNPGFYEIRVDISHLFRRTFFFEVTA